MDSLKYFFVKIFFLFGKATIFATLLKKAITQTGESLIKIP
jgi:hypothetical protein